MAPETALNVVLTPFTRDYDYVIIDVTSITLLQSCAMVFAGNVLIPVAMDMLSLQGAQTSVETVRLLNEFYKLKIQIVGFLPTNVNPRLQIAQAVSETLDNYSNKTGIPILHSVRVDQVVHRHPEGQPR